MIEGLLVYAGKTDVSFPPCSQFVFSLPSPQSRSSFPKND